MLRNLDIVKEDIDRMYNWQKLVDELQRMNRNNQEAMLTMENDKAEWARILKERDDEIIANSAYAEGLKSKLKTLEDELTTSSNLYSQKEEILQTQVKEAHAAQARIEHALALERKLTESLRNTAAKQTDDIAALQARLAKAELERDQALKGKAEAEQSHQNTRAEIDFHLFDFYVHSVMGRGSLSFLGPKFEVTLAEVWEKILNMDMITEGNYTEEELISYYLDDESRFALAKGKEMLAQERASVSGTAPPQELIIHDPTVPASSTDIVVATIPPTEAAKAASAPAKDETKALIGQASQEEKDESDDVQQYEFKSRDTQSSGNVFNLVEEDFLLTPSEFEACLNYYIGLDTYSPLPFSDITLFSLLAATSGDKESTPPPVDTSVAAGATPGQPSQPGPQSEKIAAIEGLDDPFSSQEVGVTAIIGVKRPPKRQFP